MRSSFRLAVLSALVVVLAACGTTLPGAFPIRAPSTEYVAQQEVIRRLEDERQILSRAEARAALDRATATADAALRIESLDRVYRLDRYLLSDRGPGHLAALAPDVLRVYDLSEVLAHGPDQDVIELAPRPDDARREVSVQAMGLTGDGGGPGRDGAGARLERIRRAIEEAVPEAAFVGVTGEHLFVCGPDAALRAAERVLDRASRIDGARVSVAVRRMTAASIGRSVPTDFTWLPATSADVWEFGRDAAEPLRVVAIEGVRRGAADLTEQVYVRDVEVDGGSGLTDPQIGRLVRGVACNATVARDGAGGPRLEIEVVIAGGPDEIPTFTTQLGGRGADAVLPIARIQLPATHVATHGGAAIAYPGLVGMAPGAPGEVVLVRIEDVAPGASRPGWSRVDGAAATRDDLQDSALLTNAVGLADSYLAAGRSDAGEALDRGLRSAVSSSGGTFRSRLGPQRAPVALVARTFTGDEDRLRDLLARFDVRVAPAAGFLRIEDGRLTGCLRDGDVDGLDRVLRALEHDAIAARVAFAPAGGAPTPSDGGTPILPGVPAVAQMADRLAYIADFDLQVVARAAVLDPVIGMVRSGVRAEAWARPRSDGVLDVRAERVVPSHPIPTIELAYASGEAPVTVQLPRVRRIVSWSVVDLRDGRTGSITDGSGRALFDVAPVRTAADSR